ncbi:MAG: DUF3857 domain-containing protein [Flammeovirgaceae bacterium]|nr:MAG: DUF3857 domain-containing protein [Flammeovirgaceae bacterium]
MKSVFWACVFGVSSALVAGDLKYPVSEIPAELKENANVVFREDQMRFTIHAQNRATLYVYQVVTILNDNGKNYAQEVIGYDRLSKVTLFNGASYDATGKLIKRLKQSEIYDQSAFDGFSLYSDNRLKAANLMHGSYPYTVEFEYEIEFKYLFMIPGFSVIPDEKVGVQNSVFQLVFPETLAPKYKAVNITTHPTERTTADGKKTLTWSFQNIKPVKFEPYSPPRQDLIPHIMVAPRQFEFDGYKGSTDTWEDFGKWIISLNKGRNQLPDEAKAKVKEIAANHQTNEEKVKAVYEYMQNRTRYVSIQLGIGGFQPFEANVVEKNGYGDCKALSNYMVSMLDVIGIKSHYTLIRAGRDAAPMQLDFPSSQFNHAVVCVPMEADTIWLECTSQTNPFGYAGTFTGDRKALAITDNGAKLVNTPVYTAEDNVQSRSAVVVIDNLGNASAKIKTTYRGLQSENDGLNFILGQSDKEKKWIQNHTSIPSFDISSFTMVEKREKIPSVVVKLDLALPRMASISGKRLFLTPNLMNRSSFVPERNDNRKTQVVRRMAYTDLDTIRYHVPEGLYPEFLPEPVHIKSRFGEYKASVTIDAGDVVYIRKLRIEKGEFPAETYNELVEFYKNINKADNTKLVLLNKT